MAVLAGFHVEGWDHLILKAYVARLLEIPEDEIEVDWIDQQGRGVDFVYDLVPKALHRFYGQCAQFAVVGVDLWKAGPFASSLVPEIPCRLR